MGCVGCGSGQPRPAHLAHLAHPACSTRASDVSEGTVRRRRAHALTWHLARQARQARPRSNLAQPHRVGTAPAPAARPARPIRPAHPHPMPNECSCGANGRAARAHLARALSSFTLFIWARQHAAAPTCAQPHAPALSCSSTYHLPTRLTRSWDAAEWVRPARLAPSTCRIALLAPQDGPAPPLPAPLSPARARRQSEAAKAHLRCRWREWCHTERSEPSGSAH